MGSAFCHDIKCQYNKKLIKIWKSLISTSCRCYIVTCNIQDDSGGKVNSLEGDSISHSMRKSSYKHVYNSEWLLKCPDLTLLYFFVCLWGWMKSDVYKRKAFT